MCRGAPPPRPATARSIARGALSQQLLLFNLLLRDRAFARSLARARVGARALAPDGQRSPVTAAAVAADFHEPLDVHRDLLAEIAFHAALLFDHAADLPHIVLGEILHANVGADPGFGQDLPRAIAADAVDVGQPNFDALGARKINASNSCHCFCFPRLATSD